MTVASSRPSGGARNPHGDGRYIPALDGWRAIAIMLVMLFHAGNNLGTERSELSPAVSTLSHLGALGVLVFFAISGFIITTRLHAESPDGRISLRVFYTKRCFRILPPMWAYLLFIGLLAAAGLVHLQVRDLLAPVFLGNYFPGSVYTAHFWSLAIEEHFYLLWPLCLILAGWRQAIALGCFLMLVVGVYRAIHLAALGVVAPNPGVAEGVRGLFLSRTEARIDYILAGCVVALCIIFYPAARRFVHACGSVGAAAVLAVVLLVTARVNVIDLRSAQAVIIALLVVATSLRPSVLHRVLAARPLVFLGKLSYSLYLWQQLFLARSSIAWLQSPVAVMPRIAAALLTAYISYRFLEPAHDSPRRQVHRVMEYGRIERMILHSCSGSINFATLVATVRKSRHGILAVPTEGKADTLAYGG